MSLDNIGDVDQELTRLYEEIEVATDEANELGVEWAKADATYRAAHAVALLSSDQSSDTKRRADADVVTTEAYLARQVAEEKLKGKRADVRRIEAQLDVLRTKAASYRSVG